MRAQLAFAVALCALACEPPPVHPSADHRQNTRASRIEGQLVVQGRVRGNAVVLLYDAARPPPPQGSGRPLSFTVVSEAQLFAGASEGASGPFIAPFTFSLVPPGRYVIRGFIDHGPSDFIPWYAVTSEPNAGDVGGAAVDASTRAAGVVEIPAETLAPATGVSVSFGEAATFPLDRPVFQVAGAGQFEPAQGPAVFELSSLPIDQGVIHQARPSFLARYFDEDGDGVPDTAGGAPLFWPRVMVRKLADSPSGLIEENVVLAAAPVPDEVIAALTDPLGQPVMSAVPMTKLRIAVKPQAFDVSNEAMPVALESVPSGRYAVTVLQLTSQSWRLPNELSPSLASPLGLPPIESQAFVIQVP